MSLYRTNHHFVLYVSNDLLQGTKTDLFVCLIGVIPTFTDVHFDITNEILSTNPAYLNIL